MEKKGFGAQEIPSGTLTILWQSMRDEWADGRRRP
jgi:hypothetical protein